MSDHEESHQKEIVNSTDARLQETRYGAPDGPRKRRRNFNGQDPLDYPGHEAVAQFLATPRPEREFKSLTALADHFKVTRMTVHRWKRDPDVLRRAHYLARENKPAGDLIVKANWERIVRAQFDKAIAGNTQAAKFCKDVWSDDQRGDSPLGLTMSEAIRGTENLGKIPTWLLRQGRVREVPPDNGNGDSKPPQPGMDVK